MLGTCGDFLYPKSAQATTRQQFTITDSASDDVSEGNAVSRGDTGVARRGASVAAWVARSSVPATVPVITRPLWLAVVIAWAASAAGAQVLAGRVSPPMLVAVARVYARHGNGSTGRNICVSAEAIAAEAGCSARTVNTVRVILLAAGLLYRSAGGVPSRSGRHNKPAVDHLTAPRELIGAAVDNQSPRRRKKVGTCARPRSTYVSNKSSVEYVVANHSARARSTPAAGAYSKTQSAPVGQSIRPTTAANTCVRSGKTVPQRRRWVCAYRFADTLTVRMHGFDGAARSAVAAAVYRSHLDLDSWADAGGATALLAALNVHTPVTAASSGRRYRWDWPDEVTSPGGFLASRLKYLPAQPEKPRTLTPAAELIADAGPGSSAAARNEARSLLAAELAAGRQRRKQAPHTDRCPVCDGDPVPGEQHCRRCKNLLGNHDTEQPRRASGLPGPDDRRRPENQNFPDVSKQENTSGQHRYETEKLSWLAG